jgi:hypothetical protein
MLNSALSVSFFALLKVKLCGPSTRFETEKTIVGVDRVFALSGKARLKGPEGTPSSRAVKLEPFGDRSEVNEMEVPTSVSDGKDGVTQGCICKIVARLAYR